MIIYNIWKGKDGIDWASPSVTFRAMLVTGSYTPSPNHDHPNATGLATNELVGGGYARQEVTGRSRSQNGANNAVEHFANTVKFTNLAAGSQPRWVVIYLHVNDDTDHINVCCGDLGAVWNISGDFEVRWNGHPTNGLVFRGT